MVENHTCNMNPGIKEGDCGGNCRGPAHHMQRHFITRAEKIERLKEYAETLKKELQGVEEKIREMEV